MNAKVTLYLCRLCGELSLLHTFLKQQIKGYQILALSF